MTLHERVKALDISETKIKQYSISKATDLRLKELAKENKIKLSYLYEIAILDMIEKYSR